MVGARNSDKSKLLSRPENLFIQDVDWPDLCSSSPWCWWRVPGTCPSGCGGGSRPSPRPPPPRRGTSSPARPHHVQGRSCPTQLSWQLPHPHGGVSRGSTCVNTDQSDVSHLVGSSQIKHLYFLVLDMSAEYNTWTLTQTGLKIGKVSWMMID